jgi:hypothetical protein
MQKFEDLLKNTLRWHGLPICFRRLDDPAMTAVFNQFSTLDGFTQALGHFSKNERRRLLIGKVTVKGEHIYALFEFYKGGHPGKETMPAIKSLPFDLVMFACEETVCWASSSTGEILLDSIKKRVKPSVNALLH